MSDPVEESGWYPGWEGHSMAQLRRMAKLTLIEKLEWLEQAQRTVEELKKSRHGEVHDADRDERRDLSG